MREAFKTGIGFGLTSGIITTVGLIVGLQAGTHSKSVVIGGVFCIAIADAFSDALGIHVAQESQDRHSTRAIWEATVATFVSKLVVSLTFVIPLALLPNETAIAVSVGWGMLLLAVFNFCMARGSTRPAQQDPGPPRRRRTGLHDIRPFSHGPSACVPAYLLLPSSARSLFTA